MAPSGQWEHLILVLTTSSSIQPASAPNQPFMFTFQHKRMHLLKCQCYLEVLTHRDISLQTSFFFSFPLFLSTAKTLADFEGTWSGIKRECSDEGEEEKFGNDIECGTIEGNSTWQRGIACVGGYVTCECKGVRKEKTVHSHVCLFPTACQTDMN